MFEIPIKKKGTLKRHSVYVVNEIVYQVTVLLRCLEATNIEVTKDTVEGVSLISYDSDFTRDYLEILFKNNYEFIQHEAMETSCAILALKD